MVGILNKTVPYKQVVSEVLVDESSWCWEWLYVNMFFNHRDDQFFVYDEDESM